MGGESKGFSSYTHGEGRTALGEGVSFTCRPEDKGTIATFFEEKVRSVKTFLTRTNVPHGSYGMYSRYDIQQHKYIAGQDEDSGAFRYIEVLEIKDVPDSRHGIVIYDKSSYQGSSFSEWRTVEEAIAAHEIVWKCQEKPRYFENDPETDMWAPIRELPGFKRVVRCGALMPWFYAIGEEQLVGDYAFPHSLTDDPVFRFGAKFVVFSERGFPALKTCMGTRFVPYEYDGYSDQKKEKTRLVYWDDGSCWDEAKMKRHQRPQPAQEGELWIAGAMQQFRALLAGRQTSFEIRFADGQVLKTRLMRGDAPALGSPEGKYLVTVFLHEGKERKINFDFKPSKKHPTVREWVAQQLECQHLDFEFFEVELVEKAEEGQHWSGVFLASPKNKKV